MPPAAATFLVFGAALFQSRTSLHLENLALRHQGMVYQQSVGVDKLTATPRFFGIRRGRTAPRTSNR
jgi:hypothetical protein